VTLPPYDPVFAIGIFTAIAAAVGWFIGAVVDIAAAVAAALAAVWAAVGPILIAIWHALGGAWSNVIKPAWDFAKKWGEKIWGLYTDHVKPIIDKFQSVLKYLRKVYDIFIKPIRDLISILDQFLRLSGLINTAFGRWLDGELHAVDGALGRMWAELTKPINLLLHLVNEVILDAKGLLQAPLLLESTAEYMGYIASQWWDTSLRTIHTDWTAILNAFHTGPRIKPSFDDAGAVLQGNTSAHQAAIDHGRAVFQLLTSDNYEQADYLMTGTGTTESQTPTA